MSGVSFCVIKQTHELGQFQSSTNQEAETSTEEEKLM